MLINWDVNVNFSIKDTDKKYFLCMSLMFKSQEIMFNKYSFCKISEFSLLCYRLINVPCSIKQALNADFIRIYKYITNVTRWKRNCMEFSIHLLSPLTFNLKWVPNSSAYLPPKCPFVATIKSKKDCTACACWFSKMWHLGMAWLLRYCCS